jgi:hypothetical protein
MVKGLLGLEIDLLRFLRYFKVFSCGNKYKKKEFLRSKNRTLNIQS